MAIKISVLISARKNSKYLAKFLFAALNRTNDFENTQFIVIINKGDTWNMDLQAFLGRYPSGWNNKIKFIEEDLGLGRGGLHEYYNLALPEATGDWIIYFCEDHYIMHHGWDTYVRRVIQGSKIEGDSEGKQFPLDPAVPYILVPKFDNCGAMNHIVSRGFLKALDGRIGNHGWIDSYINDVCAAAWQKHDLRHIIRIDTELFHDFTHDTPEPMSPEHNKTELKAAAAALVPFESTEYRQMIENDAKKLRRYADELQK